MKKIYNSVIKSLVLVGFFAMLVLSGCQKDSTEGPQGEKGEQGIAGADGSTLLSGNGVPTTSLGKNGDYYLDKTAVAIYGPKTSTGWGEATSIKGETGNNGKDGSKILSGTDIPVSLLGAEGDFYFDTQNIAIYGPKTTAGWGSPVSLKAPAGNGVTVLLYRNHAFQSVVRIDTNDEYRLQRLEELNEEKISAENSIAIYQQQYDDWVEGINANTAPWYTQEQKNADLVYALQQFENNTAYSRERLIQIANERASIEQQLTIGNFHIESKISLDSKYHSTYDNGMAIVYIKKAGDTEVGWSREFHYSSQIINNGNFYVYADDDNTLKNQFIIEGSSFLMPESEVKAARIDIKIVLIPATTVEVMSSKKINIKDLKVVAKYLGI